VEGIRCPDEIHVQEESVTDREEFEKTRKRLYELAGKMGLRLTLIVKRQPSSAPKAGATVGLPASTANPRSKSGLPAVAASSRRREPGEE